MAPLYNRAVVQTHFPEAVHIVDLFHAYEHLTSMAQIVWGQGAKAPKAWRNLLEAGEIGRLVSKAGKHTAGLRLKQEVDAQAIGLLEKNGSQMRYASIVQRSSLLAPA